MAGPNFIHVRDSDSIVTGIFSATRTADAGHTEYNETHPLFLPSIQTTRWERQGVNTYVDIGVDAGAVPPADRVFMTWVQSGGIENLPGNGMKSAAWGHEESLAGVKMFREGQIVGWSVAHEGTVTGGTCTFSIIINGIIQSTPALQLVLSSGVSSQSKNFVTPIDFDINDIVGAISNSVSFTDSSSNDCTLSMWYRDR